VEVTTTKTIISGPDVGTAFYLSVPHLLPDGSKVLAVVRGGIFSGDHWLIELPDGSRRVIGADAAVEEEDRRAPEA